METGECFITTAVCKCLGKSDDCYELMTLRNYRDSWLFNSDGGQRLIREYYRIAPSIVKNIEQSDKCYNHCLLLLNDYIKPCIKMIENGEYEECREKYKQMVEVARILS